MSNHSKIIFDALDNLVSEIASKYFQQEGRDMTKNLQDIKLSTIYWVSVLSIISCVLYLSTCEIVKTRHGLRNPNGVKLDMVNRQGGSRWPVFSHDLYIYTHTHKENNMCLPFRKSCNKLLDVKCTTLNSPIISRMNSVKLINTYSIF